MTVYNPFLGKEVSELEEEDLNNLIGNVAEGWFVEYKGDFQSPKKIAHSLASFANSEGGWYMVGIDAEDNSNVAKEIVGFDVNQYRNPKEMIRNIVSNNITPKPFFESNLIRTDSGKHILVVQIKRGNETPYVTNDGKIYQRIGEGSDPVALKDHYSIQKLYDRKKEAISTIENFSINPYGISRYQSDENQCFLEVYLYSKPLNQFQFNNFYKETFFEEFIENFSENVEIFTQFFTANIELNNVYSSSKSYILRATNNESSIDQVLTLELFDNGNLKLMIPFPILSLKNWDDINENYVAIYEKFYDLLSEKEKDYLKIIDGNKFFVIFITFFKQYLRFLKRNNFSGNLGIRFKIVNSWRTLLFFNDDYYIDLIKKFGNPICLKSEIEIPQFGNGRLLPYSLEEEVISLPLDKEELSIDLDDELVLKFEINSLYLLIYIYEALGIPEHSFFNMLGGIGAYIGSQTVKNRK